MNWPRSLYYVLGAIIEVSSGMPLDVFLKERLYDPLGMHDSLNHESIELGTALQTRGIYTPSRSQMKLK